jgi:aminopeptidase N
MEETLTVGLTETEAKARAALIEVESYEVFLDLGGDPDTARSRTEIRFRCREAGATTFADMSAPTVDRVVLNGATLDPAAVRSNGRLRLQRLAATNVLKVDAQLRYSRDGRGLSRFTDPTDGATYVLGYCYPTHAPDVFCCFDQPDLGASITLVVSMPAGWDCVANGAVIERPPAGAAGTWRFATVPSMKPHDLTLCAGPYVTAWEGEHRGRGGIVPLSVRCRSSLAGSADLARAGVVVSAALGFYEQLLGVACPCDKFDVVLAPDLVPKAAQVPAFMLVNESLLHRVVDSRDDFVTMVLAHEAAHLWFGCLVEGRWWDDLWLAEALATYLSYTAGDEPLGMDSPWAEFAMRDQAAAYRADSLPSTQPVSSPVDKAADALARPSAITYSKGASVIRQLAALIGDEALRAGLRSYLTRYGGGTATLSDLIGCWSESSGRELSGWAEQWLRAPGVDTLLPEMTLALGGTVESLAVLQEPPTSMAASGPPAEGAFRTHRVAVGLYEREGDRLLRRAVVSVETHGARTLVPELNGTPAPDALIVNEGDLTFAKTRFDDWSFRALAACAMDVSDPLTETVCWNATWDMTTAAELSVGEFIDLVTRRITRKRPPPGAAALIEHAVALADYYAVPSHRADLRERIAAAALAGALQAHPGTRTQQLLAVGFAESADSASQLELLRSWLNRMSLPAGVVLDLDLRGHILATLAARDLATDDDFASFAIEDPVGGEAHSATCRALRPQPAAKETAWTEALADDQTPPMALAHARGIWSPGQEGILAPYRHRYFSQALPAVHRRDPRTAQRLAVLLYPATMADSATIAGTDAALLGGDLSEAIRMVLLDQRAILLQVIAARRGATAR